MVRGLIERAIAEGVRKLVLVLAALAMLLVAFILVSAAMVAGLSLLLDLWLALALTALFMLLLGAVCFLMASRGGKERRKPAQTPEESLLHAGALLGASMKSRPKMSLFAALVAGVVLGANPSLRRDLVALLRAAIDDGGKAAE